MLDLQKILGIPDGSFHVTFDERSGFGLNGNFGTQGPLEANSGPDRAIRLSELSYEQGFYNDRIDIRVGRTNPTTEFGTSDIASEFVASIICAQPDGWYLSNGNNVYPSSSSDGFVNIAATQQLDRAAEQVEPMDFLGELRFQVVAGVIVKPYTRYVIALNHLDAPVGSSEPSNAWVVGLQVSIDLAHFLGFPKFVPF